MADMAEAESARLQLLMELAQLQQTIARTYRSLDKTIPKRRVLLSRARDAGITPQDIHRLTGVPLSTIYANTGRPIRPEDTGR